MELTLRFDGVIICPKGGEKGDQFKMDRRMQSVEHNGKRRLDLPLQ